jgi:tetratricopeptide (TPR) repeat protein
MSSAQEKPDQVSAVDHEEDDEVEAAQDEVAAIVELVTELKQEGTTLFRLRDYDGAAFKFDEAIRLSPRAPRAYDENDIASLHSNVAACYMHMNTQCPEDEHHYHQAIDRCNMALEASPRYTKALLKRARCFEALDRLDLACVDVQEVLTLEPNNAVALELLESLREEMEEKKFLLEQEARSLDDLIKVISASEKVAKQFSCVASGKADVAAVSTEIHGEQEDEHESYDDDGGQETPHGSSEEEHVGENDQDKQGDHGLTDDSNAEHTATENNSHSQGPLGFCVQEDNQEQVSSSCTDSQTRQHDSTHSLSHDQ